MERLAPPMPIEVNRGPEEGLSKGSFSAVKAERDIVLPKNNEQQNMDAFDAPQSANNEAAMWNAQQQSKKEAA